MTLSAARADTTLAAALDTAGDGIFLALHTGSPGADGTANKAADDGGDAVRKIVEFADPENHPSNIERRCLSTTAVAWTSAEIDDGQTITHFSLWSAVSGGNVEFIAAVDTPKLVGGDGVTVDIGDLEVALTVFAKP